MPVAGHPPEHSAGGNCRWFPRPSGICWVYFVRSSSLFLLQAVLRDAGRPRHIQEEQALQAGPEEAPCGGSPLSGRRGGCSRDGATEEQVSRSRAAVAASLCDARHGRACPGATLGQPDPYAEQAECRWKLRARRYRSRGLLARRVLPWGIILSKCVWKDRNAAEAAPWPTLRDGTVRSY